MNTYMGHANVLSWKVGVGAYAVATKVKDVDVVIEADAVEKTTRANQGWGSNMQGLRKLRLEFQIPWDAADAFATALRTAAFTGSEITMKALDNAGVGPEGAFIITSFPRSEPLNDGTTCSVVAEFSGDAAPTWITP